jgi:hypothetical protein
MSLEVAHKVIVPPKKILSRSFLNSGTLIVIHSWEAREGLSEVLEDLVTFERFDRACRLMQGLMCKVNVLCGSLKVS